MLSVPIHAFLFETHLRGSSLCVPTLNIEDFHSFLL